MNIYMVSWSIRDDNVTSRHSQIFNAPDTETARYAILMAVPQAFAIDIKMLWSPK